MKNFVITVVQIAGYVFIFVAFLSLLNYLFDWHLGYRGSEVPGEPEFAAVFVVLGLVFGAGGYIWDKRAKL